MAKIYTKTPWVDEVPASSPVLYQISNDNESILLEDVTIVPVTEITAGTAINAARLNNAENGIDQLDSLVDDLHNHTLYLKVTEDPVVVKEGAMFFTVPPLFDGRVLIAADAAVYDPSSSGTPIIQITNLNTGLTILSTRIIVGVGNYNTFGTDNGGGVINTARDDMVMGHRWRIDIDSAGTDVLGLDVILVAGRE